MTSSPTPPSECLEKKWNIVYTKRIAGTVSQKKVDEIRQMVIENPKCYVGIWDIRITKDSPDEDIAKYLMLEHEVIEEEDLDMEIEEVSLLDN